MLMKKLKILISTMLCLSVMCAMALPAHAMAYSFDGPGDPNYGDPTSFEPVVTPGGGAQPNDPRKSRPWDGGRFRPRRPAHHRPRHRDGQYVHCGFHSGHQ